MAWAYLIRSADRESFKRCRRAWDFGSRLRQNLEPVRPAKVFDFDQAIKEALALYYFPGMWEWDRTGVVPTVIQGFLKSMDTQRARTSQARQLSAEEEEAWAGHLALGERMLEHYVEWAPRIDDFTPLKVAADVEVNIPDPARPGYDLGTGEAPVVPIRYRERPDVLLLDPYDAYWIMQHRLSDRWLDLDQLLLDERGPAACWALQNAELGMKVQGVVYNELRMAVPEGATAPVPAARSVLNPVIVERPPPSPEQYRGLYKQARRVPEQRIVQTGNGYFRRTVVACSQTEIENVGRQIALEAMEIVNPALRIYPTPVWDHCSCCPYRAPCVVMQEGRDAGAILASSYRTRLDDDLEAGRLGASTWSIDRGGKPPEF